MRSEESRRRIARFWARAQEALYRGKLSKGAFALLHQFAQLCAVFGKGEGIVECSERQAERLLMMDAKTYRKRRRELVTAGLVEWQQIAKHGWATTFEIRLTGLISSSCPTAGNSPAVTAGKNPAAAAGKNPADHIYSPSTEGKQRPTDAVRLLPEEKATTGRSRSTPGGVSRGEPRGNGSPAERAHGENEQASEGKGAGAPASKVSIHGAALEKRLLGELRSLLGSKTMSNWGGKWRLRIRKDAGKVQKIIAEIQHQIAEGKVFRNPGGYADFLWNDWR